MAQVKMKYHGDTGYDSGSLKLHLRKGDIFSVSPITYERFRNDIGKIRFRSEVEIISPGYMRDVGEYYR